MAIAPVPVEAVAEVPVAEAPVDVMDEGAGRECIATVCRNPDGTYMLYPGDEPEGMEGEADGGQTFDTPQALLRGVMELLNPAEGAESSFGKGFRGEEDATAAKPDMPPPGM